MSFWSSLASIGTSFIPVVGPALSAGIGALTGSGKQTTANNPLNNPQIQQLLASIKTPATEDTATSTAQGFYKTVLGGSQEATSALLGPDVSTVLSQYDNASKTAAELGPRGGGRAQIQAKAGFEKAGVYGKMLAGAKEGAAKGLLDIGASQTAAKTARRGQDVSTLGAVLGGQTSANQLAFEQQKEKNAQFGELGQGIGSFLTNMLNQRKKGGGASTPTFAPQAPYAGSDTGD